MVVGRFSVWTPLMAASLVLSLLLAPSASASVIERIVGRPNGRILFSKQVGYSWDLFSVRPDGTGTTNLTSDDRAEWIGVWSPNRRRIVFIAPRPNHTGTDLFRMRADGSRTRRLAHFDLNIVPDLAWSPDGRRIAFSAGPATGLSRPPEIYTYGLRTGALRRLTVNAAEEGDPDWSPGGETLIYERDGALWTMRPNGLRQRPLGDGSIEGFQPAWSPDGSRVAFTLEGDVYVVRADGHQATRLTTSGYDSEGSPVWSADGSHIAFVRTHYNPIIEEYFARIYRMRADGLNQTRISRAGAGPPDWQ